MFVVLHVFLLNLMYIFTILICVLHSERDGLEHDRLDIQRQLSVLEGAHQTLTKERDDLHSEVGGQRELNKLKKRK